MTNEMDLLRMDERQRSAWLLANRATVMAVGLTWIGMIVWELAHDRAPVFLIAMVPVFALFRLGLYGYYLRLTHSGARVGLVSRSVRIMAASLLLVSVFLPMFRLGDTNSSAWQLVRDDWPTVFPLALAFLWPIGALLLSRFMARKRIAIVVQFAEPILAATSALIILWIPQITWGYEEALLPWLWIPSTAHLALGAHLAVAANGIYMIGWLVRLVRSPF